MINTVTAINMGIIMNAIVDSILPELGDKYIAMSLLLLGELFNKSFIGILIIFSINLGKGSIDGVLLL